MNKKRNIANLLMLALVIFNFSCSNSDDGTITVNLEDFEATLDENPTIGQSIGTIQTNGGTATNFSIASQTPLGALSIDSASGELTIANASLFNFEANSTITATVTVDNATNSSAVIINLNDLFESSVPGNTNTEFVVGQDAYVTHKAYLLVDDATMDGEYDRAFTFVFTDGDIVEDVTDEIAFETTTTVFSKVTCNLFAVSPTLDQTPFFTWDPQSNPNGFVSIIMDGHNFSQYGITNFSSANTIGGQTFGQPNGGTSHNHTALPYGDSSNGNLFTINARTFDLNTMTGTIDCSYSYLDDNGATVTGVYVGPYEILTAF
ncbi:cadherin repeat domain-containing protein [Flagellimonas nanhaiensis]|uniref:Cadherin repeat domain-containing protein n=2 Tax=Flagellimonas nanhaiensis TaxID=2292706 RepID=A0A371JVY8_9FLAO|nr:cadherin repeat domain-containing protein [Allomuricauda nanhaiensis]